MAWLCYVNVWCIGFFGSIMIALWFMLTITIVHDTPSDLDFHYNVNVGHVWSIFKCFAIAWMVFDLSSIPFELFICLQVIASRFANYVVLEFRIWIFSSMIIDVMFIVYCCQCVGTLVTQWPSASSELFYILKKPQFPWCRPIWPIWGLGNGYWVLCKVHLPKFKVAFDCFYIIISNVWFTSQIMCCHWV
jgi:hypothetical protein